MTQRWYPLRFRRKLSAGASSLWAKWRKDMSVAFLITKYYTPQNGICQEAARNFSELSGCVRGTGIDKVTPIKVAAVERNDKRLGSTDVGSDGDIIHIAEAQKLI